MWWWYKILILVLLYVQVVVASFTVCTNIIFQLLGIFVFSSNGKICLSILVSLHFCENLILMLILQNLIFVVHFAFENYVGSTRYALQRAWTKKSIFIFFSRIHFKSSALLFGSTMEMAMSMINLHEMPIILFVRSFFKLRIRSILLMIWYVC